MFNIIINTYNDKFGQFFIIVFLQDICRTTTK